MNYCIIIYLEKRLDAYTHTSYSYINACKIPKVCRSKPFLAAIMATIGWFGKDANVLTTQGSPCFYLHRHLHVETFPRIQIGSKRA